MFVDERKCPLCYFGDLGAKIPGLATFKKSILEIRKRSPVPKLKNMPKLCSKKEKFLLNFC
jgi:hypothetical protein